MKLNNTTLLIDLSEGYENTTKRVKPEGLSFSKIGRLNMLIKQKEVQSSNDPLDALNKVSKQAISLFVAIKGVTHYVSNVAALPSTEGSSKYEKNAQSKCITELVKVELIKRSKKRGFVMVNPRMLVPPLEFQKEVLSVWDSL